MPPPPPLEDDLAGMSEAEQLSYQINKVQDESLESTRRMVSLCNDTKDAGIKSLVALDDQREKLENFEKGMRDIYEDMVEAEAAMRSMGACCWGLCVPCQEKLQREPDPECFKEFVVKGGERPEELSMEGVPTFGGFVAKYTDDKREEEMEQNMEEVSNCVGNLRNMAIDMRSEITKQNDYIDKIHLMMDENQSRIDKGNEQATKLNK